MKLVKISILMILLACSVIYSCKNDKIPTAVDCTGLTVTYTTDIAPILNNNCNGCHNSTSPILTNATNAKNNIDLIIGCSKKLNGYKAMPPSGSITTDEIKKLECWKAQGFK